MNAKLTVANGLEKIYNIAMDKKTETDKTQEEIRINKYLSDAGVCSRREADRLIAQGRVAVDGHPAVNGEKVSSNSLVSVDGMPVEKKEKKVLLLFYKPRGLVCSTKQQRDETTVTDYLDYPLRIYPVGRLDKESEGLLLLTNQGDLVNKIMRAGNRHEKEYAVTVDKPVTDEFIRKMGQGVPVLDTVTRPCFAERTGRQSFRIILTQGLNRQIRRMCAYFGYEVVSLKRVRIMNLTLNGLKKGEYRDITEREWEELEKMLVSSSNETIIETGGRQGDIHTANERADSKAERGSKGLLSGRQGDNEQSGVRRSVRRASGPGRGDRNRSGRQSHNKRRV